MGIRVAGVVMLGFCTSFVQAQKTPKLITLYSFTGGSDGRDPGFLVIGKGGILYGAALYGGSGPCKGLGCGVVFSLTPPTSNGAWTEAVLYNFQGGSDGENPQPGLTLDSNGILYGSASGGASHGGVVFSLSPPPTPNGAWQQTVLHTFTGGTDGSNPRGPLALGSGSVIYGTTAYGGPSGLGTAFSLTSPASPGSSWTEVVLHNFAYGGTDGNNPTGIVMDSSGVLYGSTLTGGLSNLGTMFALAPPGVLGDAWMETILYDFSSGGSGSLPGSPVIGPGGVLYGTTTAGTSSGGGTVFSLAPPSSAAAAWTYTVLHTFSALPTSGPLLLAPNGALFGATQNGGSSHAGSLFALLPPATAGGSWSEKVLHTFGYTDGAFPSAALVMGGSGVLYGITSGGGPAYAGTVFALEP